jgi:hypothetical protein
LGASVRFFPLFFFLSLCNLTLFLSLWYKVSLNFPVSLYMDGIFMWWYNFALSCLSFSLNIYIYIKKEMESPGRGGENDVKVVDVTVNMQGRGGTSAGLACAYGSCM